jgi:hypothetical protein
MDATLNVVSTGDTLAKRYGFEPTEVPLSNWPSDTVKFLPADEVKEMAKFLINKFRPELRNVDIGYLFKQKASKSGDMTVLGTANCESEKQKALHGLEAVVVIGFDTWKTLEVDGKLRLVFHELCHLGQDMEKNKIVTLNHPVEEFPEVVQYFGPGNDAQIALISAYQRFSRDSGGSGTI